MVALNRNLAVSKGIFMYYYVIYHIKLTFLLVSSMAGICSLTLQLP